ncbi:MAG: hypothetical protein K5868_05070 [Lachnospiraceae bacterium]|nr:hypothetical protein [Lachnospiraceae bacterium]
MTEKVNLNPVKKIIIIAANILFCMWHGAVGCLILVSAAIISYGIALIIEKKKLSFGLVGPFIGIIAILLMYLYHLSGAYYPIGFSFYMLMAVGYIIDVSNEKTPAVHSFPDYFLSLGFFPILVSGPIEKIQDLSVQFKSIGDKKITSERFVYSFLMILWGLVEKVAISNIMGIIVTEVFGNYTAYTWPAVVFATVLFAFQLYADFDGYSNIAFGFAGMIGIDIHRNFKQPYLSESVKEFWRRWHISLSTWLKDYVYIPLGGSRKGIVRKYINLMVTFAVSGLWHGTGLNFLVWGLLHGIFQVIEDMLTRGHSIDRTTGGETVIKTTSQKLRTVSVKKIFHMILTFIAVDFAWFFFRAGSMRDALNMLAMFGRGTSFSISGLIRGVGLDVFNLIYMMVPFIVLIVTDVLRKRGSNIYKTYAKLPVVIRWILCYAAMFWIIFSWLSVRKFNISGFIYGNF